MHLHIINFANRPLQPIPLRKFGMDSPKADAKLSKETIEPCSEPEPRKLRRSCLISVEQALFGAPYPVIHTELDAIIFRFCPIVSYPPANNGGFSDGHEYDWPYDECQDRSVGDKCVYATDYHQDVYAAEESSEQRTDEVDIDEDIDPSLYDPSFISPAAAAELDKRLIERCAFTTGRRTFDEFGSYHLRTA